MYEKRALVNSDTIGVRDALQFDVAANKNYLG
jgi:hypothetical protein